MASEEFTETSELQPVQCQQMLQTSKKPKTDEMAFMEFTKASDLQSNQMPHSDKKPHMCDVCPQAFMTLYIIFNAIKGHIQVKWCTSVKCVQKNLYFLPI